MDKRIIKTKRNLKETFIKLLRKTPFEKINVTALCHAAETSRITFYTHYDDKYALLEEISQDYVTEAVENYHNLQIKNNAEKNVLKGYFNMFDCIINLYANHLNFFNLLNKSEHSYLFSTFYRHVFKNVEDYITEHQAQMPPKYPASMTATLLCSGLLNVISECFKAEQSAQTLLPCAREMFKDILMSDLFHTI